MAETKRSWKKALKVRPYEEHKHCIVCGRAVPLEQDFCSTECKDSYQTADKKKGKKNNLQCIFLVVTMLIMIVVIPLLTGG